ncbi:cytochrome c oxidase accessory protein CcoG [Flavisolibacter ginsenosidimutans]|uniref:Cytochrome c oxidase accessory protein CcoG n=1 Tax=Flavisolibacter ginsenosidimutans TaxID=661481 RepID=A0A5B8UEF1_9BACT|nr:cytochrome c oxidase accessory protein CcoG [Flavisolibacter ginsenosidimutans]QEC54802.1 cytochrome c oxidase accessory protein CcoG [Flavisolibacter ginsenosidimutans]
METYNDTYTGVAAEKKEKLDQSFRDSVGTITKQGKRNFLFPKKPKGKLYNLRTLVTLVFLAIFFTLPFVKIDGEPFFLFNVVERKFIFFGQIFWPQDFFIFAVGFLTFVVFIVVFTVVFGRVFCGWVCPQTIFMEMIFRKIEYWIDGDAQEQRRLKAMPLNAFKIRKRLTKIAVFYAISFLVANFFLSYIIGMDNVLKMVHEGVFVHPVTFATLMGFSTVFFFVYYWFREQACLVVCPYGRLQGVLLDKKSMVVAYDYVRGEPRGKLKKAALDTNSGDCIDCFACVRVCPTGIDIRNGTQLECINCTACIDACDDIMTKINKPLGLIRIDSEENIEHSRKNKFNWRVAAYSFVLVALLGFLAFLLLSRKDVDAKVLRTPGQIYQTLPDGRIANLYSIKLTNKTRKDIPITLKLENVNGEIDVVGNALKVPAESYFQSPFFVKVKAANVEHRKTKIRIGVYQGHKRIETAETTFMGPEE